MSALQGVPKMRFLNKLKQNASRRQPNTVNYMVCDDQMRRSYMQAIK